MPVYIVTSRQNLSVYLQIVIVCKGESFPLPSHPVASGSRGSSVDKFSPFLFLSFVMSLNKPLIVPNENGGYSFYV